MSETGSNTWEFESSSAAETVALGRTVGALARAGDLIALIGELGAGKTQFVRGLAAGMGADEVGVASPTFVMVHEYPPGPSGLVLVHIDAYRLKSAEDLESIGWDQTGGELRQGAVVAIEWADRIASMLGLDMLEVRLTHTSGDHRGVKVTALGSWRDRLALLRTAVNKAH